METRAHHVIIGLFTVVGAIAIVMFALWLARPAAERDYDYYSVIFTSGVSGLSVGSRVEYTGVRVGEVVDLSLFPEDPRQVHALIRVDGDTPVNVETKADLSLANISGAMKIQLYGGTPQSRLLDGKMPDPPVIVAEPSAISEVLDTSEELIVGIGDFIENANRLFSEENIARISHTLENLEQTSEVIAAQREDIEQALNGFSQLIAEANEAMEEVTQLASRTDASLNEPQTGVLSQAAEAAAALESASERVNRLLAENEGSLDRGLQSFGELEPALAELRGVLRNLNRVTERLEENPREFLFGGEEIEEFEP